MTAFEFLIELACKSVLAAGVILGLLCLLKSRSAAEKSMIASFGLLGLIALPFAVFGLPKLEVAVPAGIPAVFPAFSAAASPPLTAALNTAATAPSGWENATVFLYLVPAVTLLFVLWLAVARLRDIRIRASELRDPRWISALAESRRRLRLQRETVLLVSEEVNSPVSWGVKQPVIMVDPLAAADVDSAEAIVTHELAHVLRLDWLRLLLGRAAIAVFWFNPLVWALARRSLQLCEEAADDAVLRASVDETDYADLLVKAVRQSGDRTLLAANAVAARHCFVSARVAHVLDASRSRAPAHFGWLAISLLSAVGICGTLGAAMPVSVSATGPSGTSITAMGQSFDTGTVSVAPAAILPRPDERIVATAVIDPHGTTGAAPASREVSRTSDPDFARAIGSSAPAPAGQTEAADSDFHDATRVALGRERAERGVRWKERGVRWAERGAGWTERGTRWSERGERLQELAAARAAAAPHSGNRAKSD